MKNLWVLGLAFQILIIACAPTKKADPLPDDPTPPQLPVFEQGVKALEKEQYSEAARIFDRLLVAKPATEHDLAISYNSAAAYDGMGNCAKAAERYREVVRGSAGKFSSLESAAYFRLSLMYECLGQDIKAITALLDARKRKGSLSFATLNAEIPARLAAAYARLGNQKKALEYFALANKGLKRIVSEESGKRQQEILGQSLFLMGQLSPSQRRAEGDPILFLQSLSMQQPHLLQAAEVKHSVWSQKALADLGLAYSNLWKMVPTDPAKRNEFYVRSLQVTRELKRIRMPNEPPDVEVFFNTLDETERRLNTELAKIDESNKLTPDAEKRESLKKEGKLVNPPKGKKR